jgi:putative NADH-flavin reductase
MKEAPTLGRVDTAPLEPPPHAKESNLKLSIFGATGALGMECVTQALEAGHEVTVLVRTPNKLSSELANRVTVVEGDALNPTDVERAIAADCEAILFAIGVDKHSPEDLCTTATRHIFSVMRAKGIRRFIWCGGGSTPVDDDQITFGSRFVEFYAARFMGLRHRDKVSQLKFLAENHDLDWFGVRPLQMGEGPRKEVYRLGFDRFSGMSRISFADCAHAMLGMLTDDTWLRKAPIVQY